MWSGTIFTEFSARLRALPSRCVALWGQVAAFPWRNTAITLRERFREDRLSETAGNLSFISLISIVPLFAVALAIFSAFPMFAVLEESLHEWLFKGLIPEHIAEPVSVHLLEFADKAAQVGWSSAVVLLVTALSLILTIDHKLNEIWRVRRLRPFVQRVLVYWALLTLGPLVLGLSLTLSSFALSVSLGLVAAAAPVVMIFFGVLGFLAVLLTVAALYRFIPNVGVRWSHAITGALFVALAFDLAKRLLAWYLVTVPTYSAVYGAFATLPILLLWLYLVWVIVLLGAVVVAYLPSLMAGVARRGDTPGWAFQLALETLGALLQSQRSHGRGLTLEQLTCALRVDDLQLKLPLETLLELDWVGRLDEAQERYVLLVNLRFTPAGPLVERLLLPGASATQAVWNYSGWSKAWVADLLGNDGACAVHGVGAKAV